MITAVSDKSDDHAKMHCMASAGFVNLQTEINQTFRCLKVFKHKFTLNAQLSQAKCCLSVPYENLPSDVI